MNVARLVDKAAKVHRFGVLAVVRCRLARMWLGGLRRVFKFDSWHVSAPYPCRPYKRIVVELANTLEPETVIEVGCGLGDIVSRVRAIERFGFDSDLRVLRAARFLHPRKVMATARSSVALCRLGAA